jgi:xanthine/CO dehydrogenase XdhC/CoxF family maturation factor
MTTWETRRIAARYGAARAEGKHAALATVVRVRGSAYRLRGARMLVLEDGETVGSVSGGCLEADVVKKALHAVATGKPGVLVYDGRDGEDDVGTGCRGEVTVLVERLAGDCHLDALDAWLERREVGLVATVTRAGCLPVGARLLLGQTGVVRDDIGNLELLLDARALLAESRGDTRQYPDFEVCFEIVVPPPRLVLFGAGPDAEPLARLAKGLGWHVTVVEVRAGNRTRARFADADVVLIAGPDAACAEVSFGADTAVVVMTHNYRQDRRVLELVVPSRAAYVGLLGPRERAGRILEGMGRDDRIHAPVGLDIGADTPEEIALSILAEIRAFFSGRGGGRLRERLEPMHPGTRQPVPLASSSDERACSTFSPRCSERRGQIFGT